MGDGVWSGEWSLDNMGVLNDEVLLIFSSVRADAFVGVEISITQLDSSDYLRCGLLPVIQDDGFVTSPVSFAGKYAYSHAQSDTGI